MYYLAFFIYLNNVYNFYNNGESLYFVLYIPMLFLLKKHL